MNPTPYLALFNLTSGELLIVLIVIFLLFGAAKIPEAARSLGRARGEFEKGKREVDEELKGGGSGEKAGSAEESRVRKAAADLGIDASGKSLVEVKSAIAEKLK